MPLTCNCTVELTKDLSFVDIKDDPNSLTDSWITYEATYVKKPKCDAPCDTTVAKCDWTISDITKSSDQAPDPQVADTGTPDAPKCRVTVSRDGTYKFKLSLKVTVECKKKLGESPRVAAYQSDGTCESPAAAEVETKPQ